jgi:type VI secretion system secreted protein VgrG
MKQPGAHKSGKGSAQTAKSAHGTNGGGRGGKLAAVSKGDVLQVHTPLGDGAFRLYAFNYQERLGRLFELEVQLLSHDHDIAFNKLIGQPLSVSLQTGSGKPRHFHGVVCRLSQTAPIGRLASYRAIVVPLTWYLGRTTDCRIFQEETIPSILKKILKQHGISDVEDRLSGSYKPWTYCVQYRESDLNFIHRLMEQEGIYYYWKHEAKKHTMVLTDNPAGHDPMEGYSKIRFRPEHDGFSGGEDISDWQVHQEVKPTIYALNDFNFQKPKAALLAKSSVPRADHAPSLEVYDYPGEYDEHREGETYARVRIEEHQAQEEIIQGQSDSRGISAGHVFQLTEYPRKDQNRKHLVTAVAYRVQGQRPESGEGEEFRCEATFEAMDAKRPYRSPRVTTKPIIQGPQTAIVVGPKGQEIYVDDHARIKVQFHWDRYGKRDENSSCWIRVSQPWAGKGFGGMNIPRIGQEVVVEFLEGDPDQPLINGRLYNADSMPHASNAGRDGKPGNTKPSGIPAAAMMTSFKSNSLGGSGGHNEITMNDEGGKEGLFLKAQKDEVHNVGNDREDTVANNETRKVGNDRSREVGNNETVKIGVNREKTVGTDEKTSIGSNRTEQVGADESLTIGANRALTIGANNTETVAANDTKTTGANQSNAVGANQINSVGSSQNESVGMFRQASIGLIDNISAGLIHSVDAGLSIAISAGVTVTLKGPGGTIEIGPSGITIEGKTITIKGNPVHINP